MLNKLRRSCQYERMADCYDELIRLFISVTYKSSLAYGSAVLIYVWFLQTYIPSSFLLPWTIIQLSYPFFRLYLATRYKDVELTEEIKLKFQCQHMLLTLLSGVLWGMGSILCVLYAPTPYEYMVLALIIGLSAGSLSTLSPLYKVYLAFNLPALLLLILSFLLYSDTLHSAIAFMTLIYMIIVPSASWDVHKSFKSVVELNELYQKAQEELKVLNSSLENKVKEEVEHSRQKDQQMLAQSRLAQMGEMLSMIAHQWRQPLSAITATTGSMELHMQLEEYDPVYFLDSLKKINRYTQHLSTTVTDFRDFFKPDKEKALCTLNKIVQGSLHIIGTSLEAQGVLIEVFLDSKEEFYTYPNELKQVVLNIIKNAQDVFNEKEENSLEKIQKPRIFIKTQTSDNELILMIADNAGGISEEHMSLVFDPYFTTKEKRDGTGLGLYMSKMIVEEHCNGKLSVENQEEGACFIIRLPRL